LHGRNECEHGFVPGAPFTQHQIGEQFDRAIGGDDLDRAWLLAAQLDSVPIGRALALTTLLGRRGDPRFEAAALRFLERFCKEAEPRLDQVSKVADALQTLRRTGDLPAMSDGAARSLDDLRRQLDRLTSRRTG
jgi:hypothetical protein